MAPTRKTRSFNVRSCKKSLPENKEKSLAKKPPPKKMKSKARVDQETPKSKKTHASSANSTSTVIKGNKKSKREDALITDKNFSKYVKLKPKKPSPKKVKQEIPKIKKELVSLPSAISANFPSTPIEGNKNSKKEDVLITPTVMNPSLRSKNMRSPKYVNLRKQNKLPLKKEHVSGPSAISANLTSATNYTCAPIERKKNSKKENVLATPLLTSLKRGAKSKQAPNIKKEHVSTPPSFEINGNKNSKKENVLITPTVMHPCLRAKIMHSSKYVNLETKKPSSAQSTPKPQIKQGKPMIKRERLSFPSSSSAHSTSAATSQKYEANFNSTSESARNNCQVTPSMLKSCLTAYKHSPNYFKLKNKMFNTDFKFAKPRGNRNIEIVTLEDDKSPLSTESLPKIENKFKSPPGELYADIFKNLPDLSRGSDSDADIEIIDFDEEKLKKNPKKKGKKSVGYDGEPLSDDKIIPNWDYIYDIK